MDRFQEWVTFVRVVEAGSFSLAAKRLNIAKSAVSRRVTDLEERLGCRLLNRSTRKLSLTEPGEDFFERCKRILADMEEAENAASTGHGALAGTLRVAAPLTFGTLHLPDALADFLTQHPELSMDLDLNDRQVNLIEEGFDLAFRIGELSDSTLIARKLAPIKHVAIASPAYLDKRGRPGDVQDLTRFAGLRYSNVPERRFWSYRDGAGTEQTVRIPCRLAASNGDVLRQAAISGLGITVLPTFIVHESIEAGDLEIVLPSVSWRELHAYAVYPPGRHLSPRVRVFIDFLVERFGDKPYWDRCLELDPPT